MRRAVGLDVPCNLDVRYSSRGSLPAPEQISKLERQIRMASSFGGQMSQVDPRASLIMSCIGFAAPAVLSIRFRLYCFM